MKVRMFVKETRSYIIDLPEQKKGEVPHLITYFQSFNKLGPEERAQFFEKIGNSELLLAWDEI